MPLLDFLKNLQELSVGETTSSVGMFNIESGYASFRTAWVAECDCVSQAKSELQYSCKKCGRSKNNSIWIQAGDGDGVYTVITFTNPKGEVFASATLFDNGSELANKFPELIEDGSIRDFNAKAEIFAVNYKGVEIGSLDLTNHRTVYFSDSSAGLDSSLATLWVDKWGSGSITAYAFVEDSIESPSAQVAISLGAPQTQFNGGLETSIRPRVILLISDGYKKLHKNLSDLRISKGDWEKQIKSWSNQQFISNLEPNSTIAQYWNGRLENIHCQIANAKGLDDDMIEHSFREFSWYLQGATFGDEDCKNYVDEMIRESNGELQEIDLLTKAYLYRGQPSQARNLK